MKIWQLFENFSLSELNANFAELLASINGTKATYLTANKTVYVATTGSDTTGDGTSGKPYKTITKGLSVIPKNLNGFEGTLNVANGTYTESINATGFHGGMLTITTAGNITVNGIFCNTSSHVNINTLTISTITLTSSSSSVITIYRGCSATINSSISFITTSSNANPCVFVYNNSSLVVEGTLTINNSSVAIYASRNSKINIETFAGTGNGTEIKGDKGGIISYGTKTISATTDHSLSGGAIITNLIPDSTATSITWNE